MTQDNHTNDSKQSFEDWLTEKLEESREQYQENSRFENPRQADVFLGRLRAYRDVRTEFLNRKHDNANKREKQSEPER